MPLFQEQDLLDPRILEVSDRLDSIQRRPGTPFDRFGLVPPFDYQVGVPRATNLQVVKETQDVGVTHVALSWVKPLDANIDHFEVWGQNVSFQEDQPFRIADVTDAPATIQVTSDQDTAVVMYLRTIMRNGLSTGLNDSPTATTNITHNPISTGDIPDESIGDAKLDRTTDPIQIANADITSLNAAKINAGFLAAARLDTAVAYISQAAMIANAIIGNAHINDLSADKINAGTLTSINIVSGTYSLVSGGETMTITGTDGFEQVSTGNGTIRMLNGALVVEDTGNDPIFEVKKNLAGTGRATVFDGSASDVVLVDIQGNSNGGDVEINNDSGTERIRLGVTAGDDPYIEFDNSGDDYALWTDTNKKKFVFGEATLAITGKASPATGLSNIDSAVANLKKGTNPTEYVSVNYTASSGTLNIWSSNSSSTETVTWMAVGDP